MSWTERRAWLICYDIANPRRIQQVHGFLKSSCLWVQYSVFAAWLNEREIQRVITGLEMRIKSAEDDVRVYPLPANCETITMGSRLMPIGVLLPDQQLLRLLSER
jgi:CRISPR-associated protein Cas2